MKWNFDARKKRKQERFAAQQEWHSFFAIIPHSAIDGDWHWLETMERRKIWYKGWILVPDQRPYYGWKSRWQYRALSEREGA